MFGTRKLGKTSAQRKALLRQQVTDLLANGQDGNHFLSRQGSAARC